MAFLERLKGFQRVGLKFEGSTDLCGSQRCFKDVSEG